jgi:hypothetical protein
VNRDDGLVAIGIAGSRPAGTIALSEYGRDRRRRRQRNRNAGATDRKQLVRVSQAPGARWAQALNSAVTLQRQPFAYRWFQRTTTYPNFAVSREVFRVSPGLRPGDCGLVEAQILPAQALSQDGSAPRVGRVGPRGVSAPPGLLFFLGAYVTLREGWFPSLLANRSRPSPILGRRRAGEPSPSPFRPPQPGPAR